MTVSDVGLVTLTGMLADGVSVMASSALLAGDTVPFFVQMTTPGAPAKEKGGSFGGTLNLDPALPDTDVAASALLWFRPAADGFGPATDLYTEGWPNGIQVEAFGSLYATRVNVQASLELDGPNVDADDNPETGNAELQFSKGKLATDLTKNSFNIDANAVIKITPVDTSYALTLAPTAGTFKGAASASMIVYPSIPTLLFGAKPAFKGILIQKGTSRGGYGFFISNVKEDSNPESGNVMLKRH
jgi:hypothetical protein